MNCCTVLIKIKDFIPKLSKESYDNYICIFNNNEFEGRISLMQYEYQHINHEIKDIKSDIIYKIKVIDLISKEIIGISEHCIKYEVINNLDIGTSINFINQIRVSPKRKNNQKISSNFIYYSKLNLTISTEIIKFNKNPVNYISKENSEFLKLNLKLHSGINNRFTHLNRDNINNNYYYNKKINSSINNKKINSSINNKGINSRLNNEMNNMSLIKDKNNISSGLINEDDKNNINLNMHNITVQNYYTINSSPPLNINSVQNKKIYTKKYFKKKNMNKIKNNKIENEKKENFYNFWKQNEINYNNIKIKKGYQSSTAKSTNKNNTTDYFSSIENMEQINLSNRNIKVRKRIIRTKKRKTKYNNNSFKVINLSSSKNNSVEKINNNMNSYRCTSTKKDENKYKLDYKRINSFKISSYNLTYNSNSLQKQKYSNKLESIISPKNNANKKKYSLKSISYKNLTERLKSNRSKDNLFNLMQIGIINLKKSNNSFMNKKNNKYRKECKKNIISILQFYILLNKKMKKLKDSYYYNVSKYLLEKEKYMNIMEKKNIIEEKNNENKIKGYIYVNINSKMNNQIISKFKNIKKKEIKLFEIIFNKEITKNDISDRLTEEKILNEEEKNKINLYLNLLKNMIRYYGNISQIYDNNKNKKYKLLRLLINNGIEIYSNDFLYKKKENNIKEIKEEIEEGKESILNKETNTRNNEIDKSILNINENNKNDIIERILISEFTLKYGNITNKKFIKIKSNEYSFNNEFKILASYNNNKIILKIKAKKDCINKEYTLDEFVSIFIKNINIYEENIEDKSNNKLTNLENNKKKINYSYENNSRNHKIVIIKEMAFKDDLNKKCINKKNVAKSQKDDTK